MRIRELRGIAQNLAAMACSERRIADDFELMAEMPDGEITFDLIRGTALHSVAGAISLAATDQFMTWLRNIRPPPVDLAQILLHVDTNSPPTFRKTLISFRLYGVATLGIGARTYVGRATNHLWHNRPAQPSLQATRPLTRPPS